MNSNAHRRLPPNARDSAIARVSGQTLSRYAGADSPLKLQITASEPAEPIELPAGAVNLLMQILEAIAAGRGAVVIPENTELTTLQAAEVLSVSRPFLIKLLEEKKIPHRKVGRHRRIRIEDIIAYQSLSERNSEAALSQLVKEAQEQDMGCGYGLKTESPG